MENENKNLIKVVAVQTFTHPDLIGKFIGGQEYEVENTPSVKAVLFSGYFRAVPTTQTKEFKGEITTKVTRGKGRSVQK